MRYSPSPAALEPKKSVALSGVAAGNTALCTVSRTGIDLHYRGCDIQDAERLMAWFGSMLLYWHHYAHNGRRIEGKIIRPSANHTGPENRRWVPLKERS